VIVETVLAVRRRSRKTRRAIIIKAEGVAIAIDRLKAAVDARLRDRVPRRRPGDQRARGEVSRAAGIETRVTVLGHVVRGGRPSAFDR
jgi:6-phosphofructokinase